MNPQSKTLLLILLVSVTGLMSCSHPKECPDIDEEIFDYLPYEESDEIIFHADDQEEFLLVNQIRITDTERSIFDECKCNVGYRANFILRDQPFTIYHAFGYETLPDGFGISFPTVLEEGTTGLTFQEFHDEVNLEGKNYKNVYSFRGQYRAELQEILVALDIGLISVTVQGTQWIIMNPVSKNLELSDFEVVQTCS